jgi:hypothetical protein
MDDLLDRLPGKGLSALILGGISVVALVGLALLGGQTSSILSNVGNAIGQPDVGGRAEAGGAASGGGTSEQTPADPDDQVADAAATAPELLIIRTGTLVIEVDDVDAAVATARERVVALGGFVSGSDQASDGGRAQASVTFRVPADRWEDALDAVRGLASATRDLHVETQAVTNQVIDLGARIANLRATEAALQKIMAQATKIPDVLDVQEKLTGVRGEIERLVAEKQHLEEQAAFGTLAVTFALPPPPVVEEVKAGWDPAADADAATGALIGLGQRLASFGIWVGIVGVPVGAALVVLLLSAIVAWRIVRRAPPEASES